MCKKIQSYFLIISCFFIVNQNLFSQITGGGNVNVKKEEPITTKKKVFKNSTYLTLNISKAIGKYGNSIRDIKSFEKRYGDMNSGLGISVGRLFFLNSIDMSKLMLNDQFKIGIDAKFFNYTFINGISNQDLAYLFDDNFTHFANVGIGGVFSYNPVDRLIIDFKFALEPSFTIYQYESEGYYDPFENQYFYERIEGNSFTVRKNMGLYVRYRPFTFGFSLNWGRVNLNADHYEHVEETTYDSYLGEYVTTWNFEPTPVRNVKTSTMRFDFVIGFSF